MKNTLLRRAGRFLGLSVVCLLAPYQFGTGLAPTGGAWAGEEPEALLLRRLESGQASQGRALIQRHPKEAEALAARLARRFDESVHSRRSEPDLRRVQYDEAALVLGLRLGTWHHQVTGSGAVRDRFRARRLRIEATKLANMKDYARARSLLARSLDLAPGVPDPDLAFADLLNLSFVELQRGDLDASLERAEEAFQLASRQGQREKIALALYDLALVRFDRGERSRARELAEQARGASRTVGRKIWEGNAALTVGVIELEEGRPDTAVRFFREALELFRASGDRLGEGRCLYNLGLAARGLGLEESAANYFRLALPIVRGVDIRHSHDIDEANPYEESSLRYLARFEEARGHEEEAHRWHAALLKIPPSASVRSHPGSGHSHGVARASLFSPIPVSASAVGETVGSGLSRVAPAAQDEETEVKVTVPHLDLGFDRGLPGSEVFVPLLLKLPEATEIARVETSVEFPGNLLTFVRFRESAALRLMKASVEARVDPDPGGAPQAQAVHLRIQPGKDSEIQFIPEGVLGNLIFKIQEGAPVEGPPLMLPQKPKAWKDPAGTREVAQLEGRPGQVRVTAEPPPATTCFFYMH